MSSKALPRATQACISRIAIRGFKSFQTKQEIKLRPLTLLAGSNSSGKSSMLQPLLLLKQTLETPYDPGPLLIRGPNVEFSEVKQMFCQMNGTPKNPRLELEFQIEGTELRLEYSGYKGHDFARIELVEQTEKTIHGEITLRNGLSSHSIIRQFKNNSYWGPRLSSLKIDTAQVTRNRCFLEAKLSTILDELRVNEIHFFPGKQFGKCLEGIIHLPGARGNPERAYPIAAMGDEFPGISRITRPALSLIGKNPQIPSSSGSAMTSHP